MESGAGVEKPIKTFSDGKFKSIHCGWYKIEKGGGEAKIKFKSCNEVGKPRQAESVMKKIQTLRFGKYGFGF